MSEMHDNPGILRFRFEKLEILADRLAPLLANIAMALSWSHDLKLRPRRAAWLDSLSGCRERGTTAALPLHPAHLDVLG